MLTEDDFKTEDFQWVALKCSSASETKLCEQSEHRHLTLLKASQSSFCPVMLRGSCWL